MTELKPEVQKVLVTNVRFDNHEKDDYYATDPIAIDKLLEVLKAKNIKLTPCITEPCVGAGHLAHRLTEHGYHVVGYDIVDRGYPDTTIRDMTIEPIELKDCDVVTNPPFKHAVEILENIFAGKFEGVNGGVKDGTHVCVFLKLLFLEGLQRKKFLQKYPPKYVAVSSRRIACARNGEFNNQKQSAVCYCWYIWEKGYKGATELLWF